MSSLSNKLEATAAAISNTNNSNLVVTSPFKNVLATTQKKFSFKLFFKSKSKFEFKSFYKHIRFVNGTVRFVNRTVRFLHCTLC